MHWMHTSADRFAHQANLDFRNNTSTLREFGPSKDGDAQIEIDSQGVAWLAGTQVKVVEIVLDKLAHGWSPEEIHFQDSSNGAVVGCRKKL